MWREKRAGGVAECIGRPQLEQKTLAKAINNSSIFSPKERRGWGGHIIPWVGGLCADV